MGLEESLLGVEVGPTPQRPRCLPLDPSAAGAHRRGSTARPSSLSRSESQIASEQMRTVRKMVHRRTARLRLQRADREEIVSAVMERLVAARRRGGAHDRVPEAVLVAQNVEWAVADFCRAAMRRATHERLTAPAQMPQPPAPSAAVPLEEREAIGALLEPLSEREKQILFERYALDMAAAEVAERAGVQTGALKVACSRALRRLREAGAR
jgi:RNA polymerase sigma factor (sigma-70 family)